MILLYGNDRGLLRVGADAFRRMGILADFRTPDEGAVPFLPRAAVFFLPEDSPAVFPRVGTPTVALSRVPVAADLTLPPDTPFSGVLRHVDRLLTERGLPRVGDYAAGSLSLSAYGEEVRFREKALSLTLTEKMILRALAAADPLPVSARDLLRLAFSAGKPPEVATVRAFLSSVNRKSRDALGFPLAVRCDGGYRLPDAVRKGVFPARG